MSRGDWTNGRVLVFGAGGMLGRELMGVLADRLAGSATDRLVGFTRHDLDICDRDAVRAALWRIKPDVALNAAAYTDVDGCETNIDRAKDVNAEAPGPIAHACGEVGAKLVHFGTDYIFDGKSHRPYRPDDDANPLSVYGRSKWAGEQAVAASGCRHLIVRTSGLFGSYGRNFVEAILARAESGQELRVVSDQIGRVTWARDLAHAVSRFLDTEAVGTFHFADSGECSWLEFAEEIVRQAGLNVPVRSITADQLGRPAKRPAYAALDTSGYEERTSEAPPHWRVALRDYLMERDARAEAAALAVNVTSQSDATSLNCNRVEPVGEGLQNERALR